MVSSILIPVLVVGGMGLIFGVLLGVASKVFAVKEDERVPKILEVLPGANCGGCGFAGCSAYATALCKGGVKTVLRVLAAGKKCVLTDVWDLALALRFVSSVQ